MSVWFVHVCVYVFSLLCFWPFFFSPVPLALFMRHEQCIQLIDSNLWARAALQPAQGVQMNPLVWPPKKYKYIYIYIYICYVWEWKCYQEIDVKQNNIC